MVFRTIKLKLVRSRGFNTAPALNKKKQFFV